uniref:(northern house mosquito) hypothetical protein n=1 Tax=Culex pipiens TaxID=7175 RepID=A0A8D8A2V1_CULPI
MGGGAGCVCGVEAVDDEEEDEEEGEPTAADVCSTTAVATGAEAATSSDAEAGAAAAATTAADEDDGGDDELEGGSELWDDGLPGILGNEHTSQRVMSSWFWNVQRLQVHCSPAIAGCGCGCWGSCGSAGADIERPPWYRPPSADATAAAAGSCWWLVENLGGGGRGGRGGRFTYGPVGCDGDPSILSWACCWSTSFCIRSTSSSSS